MLIGAAVDPRMIMSMIGKGVATQVYIGLIGYHRPAFPAGNGFDKIKGIGSGIADRAQVFPFIRSANTLAGVFQQQQVMLLTDLPQRIHISHASAHMHRHNTTSAGRNGLAHRPRIKRKAIVNIDQNRRGAYA